MRAVLFGATGMVGQSVLRECLRDSDIEMVIAVGRSATGVQNPKLREIMLPDLLNYAAIESQLRGFDACFFCLGVSSVGMKPEEYERITYGITMAAAETLARLNPQMAFIYVSGAGTDSSEKGRVAWARVKGRTENALLRLPFKAAYMFRPAFIQPLHGVRSRTASVRLLYAVLRPIMPLLRRVAPKYIVTSEQLGRAMLAAAKRRAPKQFSKSRTSSAWLQVEQDL
jgi:uncharacterized protein YbjT (DUF2867 family)